MVVQLFGVKPMDGYSQVVSRSSPSNSQNKMRQAGSHQMLLANRWKSSDGVAHGGIGCIPDTH